MLQFVSYGLRQWYTEAAISVPDQPSLALAVALSKPLHSETAPLVWWNKRFLPIQRAEACYAWRRVGRKPKIWKGLHECRSVVERRTLETGNSSLPPHQEKYSRMELIG